jgi:hypothetical protein
VSAGAGGVGVARRENPAKGLGTGAPPAVERSGLGLRVQGSGFRVLGSGFRVEGYGFWVLGSGFQDLR